MSASQWIDQMGPLIQQWQFAPRLQALCGWLPDEDSNLEPTG
jgi:hypothetical protein